MAQPWDFVKGRMGESTKARKHERQPHDEGYPTLIWPGSDQGSAVPVADMPTRGATASPKEDDPGLTPLNFRVPADFRRTFKTYAASHDLKLNALLKLSFESYRKQQGD
jgi:hypothetical protein